MSDSVGHRQRGQSELIGIVLLFALVITVSLTVVVVGGSALSDLQSDTMKESAEVSMVELQSKAAKAGFSGASVQEVSFVQSQGAKPAHSRAGGTGSKAENVGSVSLVEGKGKLTVEITDGSGGSIAGPTTKTLGKITYERDGETLVYQGGGVFRKNTKATSSQLVSPPNFEYQYRKDVPTLSLPVTKVTGSVDGDEFSMQKTGSSRIFPTSTAANPVQSGNEVHITVKSEFYQAWGSLFKQRTDGRVTYNHGANEVKLVLETPVTAPTVSGALLSGGGTLTLKSQTSVDSYDSRNGRYSSQIPGSTTVYSKDDVTMNAQTSVNGDLVVEGDVTLKAQSSVPGTIHHQGSLTPKAGSSYGSAVNSADVPEVTNRDTLINDRINEYAVTANNDNSANSNQIRKIENAGCGKPPSGSPCVLTEGDYHLSNIDLSNGRKLVLRPNNGRINIGVEGKMDLAPNGKIEVDGDGKVVFYSRGNLEMGRAKVFNDGDDAPQLWMFMRSDTQTEIKSQTKFVGVVHAGKTGYVSVGSNQNGDIYGAVVGAIDGTNAGRDIHYDRALASANPFSGGASTGDLVSYLRITVSEMSVES